MPCVVIKHEGEAFGRSIGELGNGLAIHPASLGVSLGTG
jgi:hypothetical protein